MSPQKRFYYMAEAVKLSDITTKTNDVNWLKQPPLYLQ